MSAMEDFQAIRVNASMAPYPTMPQHPVLWTVIDTCLTIVILAGNTLTISAVKMSRRLSQVMSNQFVLSLAVSDFLVGLTLPYHLAFYLYSSQHVLSAHRSTCVLRFVLISVACCASIYSLIAIAVDRYIAIVHPLHYNRYMTKRLAYSLIFGGWLLALGVATIPIYWNNWQSGNSCELKDVLPKHYVTCILTPMFATVWAVLLLVYLRIWREAAGHAKRLRMTSYGHQNGARTGTSRTHCNSDWKSVQVVLFVLGGFSICWLPYIIMACIEVTNDHNDDRKSLYLILYKSAFSLAMANSGMNPIIYAWKNTGFRKSFIRLLRCHHPDAARYNPSFRNMYNNSNCVPLSNRNSTNSLNQHAICNGSRVSSTLEIVREATELHASKEGRIPVARSNGEVVNNNFISKDEQTNAAKQMSDDRDSRSAQTKALIDIGEKQMNREIVILKKRHPSGERDSKIAQRKAFIDIDEKPNGRISKEEQTNGLKQTSSDSKTTQTKSLIDVDEKQTSDDYRDAKNAQIKVGETKEVCTSKEKNTVTARTNREIVNNDAISKEEQTNVAKQTSGDCNSKNARTKTLIDEKQTNERQLNGCCVEKQINTSEQMNITNDETDGSSNAKLDNNNKLSIVDNCQQLSDQTVIISEVSDYQAADVDKKQVPIGDNKTETKQMTVEGRFSVNSSNETIADKQNKSVTENGVKTNNYSIDNVNSLEMCLENVNIGRTSSESEHINVRF